MNNSSLLKKTKSLFLDSLSVINNNLLIYVLSLAIAFRPLLEKTFNFPKILSLIVTFLLIGWMGAKLDLVLQAYKKKKIEWNQLGNLMVSYFKKILPIVPIAVIAYIFLFFALMISSVFYFKPILSGDYSSFERKQLISEKIQLFQETSIDGLTTFSLEGLIFSFVISLILFFWIQSLVIMVVDQKNILISLKKAGSFFYKNISFFLLLSLIITVVNHFLHSLLGVSIEMTPGVVLSIIILVYINLVVATMILLNYFNSKK